MVSDVMPNIQIQGLAIALDHIQRSSLQAQSKI